MFLFRETIRKYRLCPTELNVVVRHLCGDTVTPLHAPLHVFRHDKEFVIFPMCKDAESKGNEDQLQSVGQLIEAVSKGSRPQNRILLIPLFLCRGYLKVPTTVHFMKRKHAVLLMIDMASGRLKILDSQGFFRNYFYPDKLSYAGKYFNYDRQRDYVAFAKQEGLFFSDVVSCGYYVIACIEHILRTGSYEGCENITLNIMRDYRHKWDYFNARGVDIICPPEYAVSNKGYFSSTNQYKEELDDFVMLETCEEKDQILPFEIEKNNEITISLATFGLLRRSNSLSLLEENETRYRKVKCEV